jgi:hypothetical protein
MQIATDTFTDLIKFTLEDHSAHVCDHASWESYRSSMAIDAGTALILWSSAGFMNANVMTPGIAAGFELARTN